MEKGNIYEGFFNEAIASFVGFDISNLRLFANMPALPNTDAGLYSLFDIVPGKGPIFDTNENRPRFSPIYGQILQSQNKSFLFDLASKNYGNPNYWITENLPQTPIYTPTLADIVATLSVAPSYNAQFNSQHHGNTKHTEYHQALSTMLNQPQKDAQHIHSIVRLQFNNIALVPVKSAGWFTSGAFTKAYKDPEWKTGTGTITWDSLFGNSGSLLYINTATLAAKGIKLEIEFVGKHKRPITDLLISSLLSALWPFDIDNKHLEQYQTHNKDGNLTFTFETPKPTIYLLAMAAEEVSKLEG